MGLFDKNREPIILKETSSAQEQTKYITTLLRTASPAVKQRLEQDLKMLSYGIYGENQILYELKNSHMPMYILHDLYIEDNGLSAQIDFLIITEKIIFIVECKNLIGDIEINENGDFIRTVAYNGKFNREGIYSPITQNQRHLDLLKQVRGRSKTNFLTKAIFEKCFRNLYKGVVVLSNSKTVLNDKNAKKEVRQQVIRADQLISYIQESNSNCTDSAKSDKEMEALAQFFLSVHKENKTNYCAKYGTVAPNKENCTVFVAPKSTANPNQSVSKNLQNKPEIKPDLHSKLYNEIRRWCAQRAKKDGVQAYIVFYNTTLDDLVEKKPKTIMELKNVIGFGDIKCQKYGAEVIKIIKDNE